MTVEPPGALMRASHILQNLDSLKILGDDVEAKVLALMGPELEQQIRGEIKTNWLPLEFDVRINDALDVVIGSEGIREHACHALTKSFEGPLLRPVLDGGLRIFGIHPQRMFTLLPRGFTLVYRNCGALRAVATSDSSLQVIHDDAPMEMIESRPYLLGMAGAFLAIFRITRVNGDVEVGTVDAKNRKIVYDVRWSMTKGA